MIQDKNIFDHINDNTTSYRIDMINKRAVEQAKTKLASPCIMRAHLIDIVLERLFSKIKYILNQGIESMFISNKSL